MIQKKQPKLIFFITTDWFFCSHFLSRAIAARMVGYKVLVVTNIDSHRSLIRESGIEPIHLSISRRSLNPLSALIILFRLIILYMRERPDIIHHVALKPILLGVLAARITGTRNVINAFVGGGYAFTSSGFLAKALRSGLMLGLRYLLNPPGSRVVFENSDDLNDFVEAHLVKQEDAVLIRGAGVDPAQFRLSIVPHGHPLVVLVARLLWDKGVGEFVEAAQILRGRGVKARFVIVGRPDFENRASIDLTHLKIWEREGAVELWGFRSDIASILTQSAIACLPSYREGLPKFLLEAMAAGLPCITTDVPGCREAVQNGDNGFLVPVRDAFALADAIEILIRDPELSKQMGIRGRQRLEREFSTEHVNEKTLALYNELLGR